MKQFNNYAFIALSALVLGSAAYVGYREVSNDETSDLLMANVEALTDGECTNTWTCEYGPGICSMSCHRCGIHIVSEGTMRGTHCCGN